MGNVTYERTKKYTELLLFSALRHSWFGDMSVSLKPCRQEGCDDIWVEHRETGEDVCVLTPKMGTVEVTWINRVAGIVDYKLDLKDDEDLDHDLTRERSLDLRRKMERVRQDIETKVADKDEEVAVKKIIKTIQDNRDLLRDFEIYADTPTEVHIVLKCSKVAVNNLITVLESG